MIGKSQKSSRKDKKKIVEYNSNQKEQEDVRLIKKVKTPTFTSKSVYFSRSKNMKMKTHNNAFYAFFSILTHRESREGWTL